MTWARDFSCNNIRCKNYKVKIDADTEQHFCESCTAQIQELGLCLSCGVEKATAGRSILFPWLCGECEAIAKAEFFNKPLSVFRNRRRPVQERDEPITRQLPGPIKTSLIIVFLCLLIFALGPDGQLGVFLLILTTLFALWLPISIISGRMRRKQRLFLEKSTPPSE